MSDRKNIEGYSDPTAYQAMKKVEQDDQRIRYLRKTLDEVCLLSGYRIKGEITFIEKRTGRIRKL